MDKKHELDALDREEADLQRRLEEVRERRAHLGKSTSAKPPGGGKAGPALRDQLLHLLDEAKAPLNSLLLASVMRPLLGRQVMSTRFGTLSNDEVKSYESSRARPVYLCHCLTYDHAQPVKRFWARSDWPLAERVMGPMTGRVLFLRGAAWAIASAQRAEGDPSVAADVDKLKYVAADQARDAGLTVKRGEFPYVEWLRDIDALLQRHLPEDLALRKDVAPGLAERLSEHEQLFGSSKGLVSLPGSRATWRSASE